jgi:hypothetical protein
VDKSPLIKFHRESCGRKITIPRIHAGKKGICPKCKSPVAIPQQENVDIDSLLLGPPPKNNVQNQKGGSAGLAEDVQKLEEKLGIAEKPEPVPQRKFPWPVDIFLYPLNLAGIIHLVCLWLLVFFTLSVDNGLLGFRCRVYPCRVYSAGRLCVVLFC